MSTDPYAIPERPPLAIPLKGYLVKETAEQVWVQDNQGTWIVNAKDIVGRDEWAGMRDARFSGTPGIFHVKDGAEIKEIRTVTVKALRDWPLAISESTRGAEVKGGSNLDSLARARVQQLQTTDYECVATYSMGADHTGWGMVIHRDDWVLV
jgi:hypothetical protein